VIDFSIALQSCIEKSKPKTSYVALIEADMIFAHGWHARTMKSLQDIERKYAGHNQTWLDLRLFNPEMSTGWGSRATLGNNVPLIIAGISSSILTAALIIRNRNRHRKGALLASTWLSTGVLFVVCVFAVPVLVITFFQAGKASIVRPWPGVKAQNWGCCSQAVVMPRSRVRGLINELQAKAGESAPDLIIRDYAKNNGLTRWVLDPVQAQHMGTRNSLINPDRREEETPWSMAFEDLNPMNLKREHAKLVRQLYPLDDTKLFLT
jgi:hypothetical protein